MERSFVLVLTLVILAAGTPHGYGVKGGAGASAKAEASAVAGAFGGLGPVPLSIPSGSGYSGSFSKSSSSSFASSSASASSSSFSFSGSGANGIAGIGTDKGCSSGTCPGAGAAGPSSNGDQQHTGANAVSAAQAKSLSGSYAPCQGTSCNGSPSQKCTTGQCSPDSAASGQNGCAGNGNCQSPSGSGSSGSEDKEVKNNNDDGSSSESNDFAVNINRNQQSKLSHDSNGQYSNKDKSYNTESGCSDGKCGPGNSDQTNFGSNPNKPPVPSSYLTAPNTSPPCTTPNCNYPAQSNGPYTSGLPSSYNVPIQSATNPPNTYYSPSSYGSAPNGKNSVTPGVPCTSPSCSSIPHNVGTSNIPNYQPGQQGPSNQGPCASGKCDNPSSTNGKTNYGPVPVVPNYSHGSTPSNVPTGQAGQPGCTAPYCSGLPTYSSPSTNQPGNSCNGGACSSPTLTASPTKLSDSNAPVYTGGFGGPPGFLDIQSGYNKAPGNTPGSNKPTVSVGSTPALGSFGTTNSNNNYGSTQSSSNGGSTGTFEYNKPSSVPSSPGSHYNPPSTGSYGGAPTASSPVPLGLVPHPSDNGNYKPTTSQSGPTYTGGIDGSTGSSHINLGSNSIGGSYGATKPHAPSYQPSSPTYTGGFGGPSGIDGTKPGSGNCGSANCNGQLDGNISGGTYDKTKPSNSQYKPVYTGGFGGSAGFLSSNNGHVPSNTPTVSSGSIPCVNGNCGSKGTPSSSQGSSLTSAHNLVAASASANAAVYSGGFGGPPGFLKPYDDGKVNTQGLNGNLATGNTPSSNNGHPNTPSVTGKSSEPGSYASGANAAAQASATASASAGSYGGDNNNGSSRGCNSGCSPNGSSDGSGIPDGLTKSGFGTGALASAKSSAAANAFGNFASSSASAHASAGAATKGGYGRK